MAGATQPPWAVMPVSGAQTCHIHNLKKPHLRINHLTAEPSKLVQPPWQGHFHDLNPELLNKDDVPLEEYPYQTPPLGIMSFPEKALNPLMLATIDTVCDLLKRRLIEIPLAVVQNL